MSLDGTNYSGAALVDALERCASRSASVATSTSARPCWASKGRVGFEAGSALVLIAAHRELEKLVQTKWRASGKITSAAFTATACTRGAVLRPGAARHREALLLSSQERVTGETRCGWRPGTSR